MGYSRAQGYTLLKRVWTQIKDDLDETGIDRFELLAWSIQTLIADAIDTAVTNGSGSSNQPLGILQTSGIGSVAGGTNGLAPTLDNLLDLKKEVAVDKADVVSCGFLTNKKVESVLGKLMDSQGQRSADDDSDAVCTGGPHH